MKIDSSTHHLIEPHNKAYNPVDKIFRMIMGDYASISNSWPGEYGAQTKENVLIAQQKKYEEYFKHLGLKENAGMKIFEIGPGWGPFSNYFVSPKDNLEGNQDKVYRQFFDYAHGLLKPGGRVGGQFMTFNGRDVDYNKFQVDKDSKDDEESMYYHLGLLTYRYPDAWLPRDSAHFISCAKPGDYKTIKVVDGREHYIWTARCWINTFNKPRPFRKWFKVSGLVINSFFNKDFSYWAKAFYKQSNRLCFEKGWMGHEFFFVEKN